MASALRSSKVMKSHSSRPFRHVHVVMKLIRENERALAGLEQVGGAVDPHRAGFSGTVDQLEAVMKIVAHALGLEAAVSLRWKKMMLSGASDCWQSRPWKRLPGSGTCINQAAQVIEVEMEVVFSKFRM